MKALVCRFVISALLSTALVSCRDGSSTDIGDEMAFSWYGSHDYTNIYHGGAPRDGGVPVIPGGCDSAKWNDRYVLTKGEYWRYRVRKDVFGIIHPPPDSLVYFVVDKKRYDGHQELDPALHGPLTKPEQADWERRIPGRYQVPE
ncbi:hypothetical protein GCM10022409_21590 [Hymenobacter glaciei]|uniref:Lipoprotein n=1 Tax=Hymenobacter glaciei TaxID=877209 RepID=A0ABP7U5N5_9BACT